MVHNYKFNWLIAREKRNFVFLIPTSCAKVCRTLAVLNTGSLGTVTAASVVAATTLTLAAKLKLQ